MPSFTKVQSSFLDNTSPIELSLGSVSVPSLTFSGDPNTGLYSPGADQLAISTGGAQRLYIDASGNLLSGTTSNLAYPGRVFNLKSGQGYVGVSVSDTEARIFNTWDSSAIPLTFYMGGSERMRIEPTAGNVGIGTTNPSTKLAVSGTVSESTDGTNYYPVVTQQDIGTAENQIPVNSYLGNLAFQDVVSSLNRVGIPRPSLYDDLYFSSNGLVNIGANRSGTSDYYSNRTNAVNNGIYLDCADSAGNTAIPYLSGKEGKFMGIMIRSQNEGGFYQHGYLGVVDAKGTSNRSPDFVFGNRVVNSAVERLRFLGSNGNVGISHETPFERLTVTGNIIAQNNASLGTDKVTNGTFATSSNWTFGSGWTFDATNLRAAHTASGGTAALEQNVSAVANEIYQVTFTVVGMTAGFVTASVGGASGRTVQADGTYTQFIRASGTGNLLFTPTTEFDGAIDTVSVQSVIGGNIAAYGLFTGGGSSGLKIDTTGRLLVGTSSLPTSSTTSLVSINGSLRTVTTNSNAITIQRPADVWSANDYNDLLWQGVTGGGVDRPWGRIRVQVTLASGSGSPTFMSFHTNGDSSDTTERMRISAGGNVGIGTTNPTQKLYVEGGSTYINKYGDNVSNSYGLYVNTTGYAPNDSSGPHYGLRVRQVGARYTLNYGIYSEVVDDIGFYGASTIDGMSLRGCGVYGFSPCSTQAYIESIGVYGKTSMDGWNYNRIYGIKGYALAGTTSFGASSSILQAGYGGHFLSTGKGNCIGVYADAYLAASPGAGAEAVPLMVSTGGTELFRVTSTGFLRIGTSIGAAYSNIVSSDSNACNIYVSNSGSDSTGDGSSANPYRSLARAFLQVPKLILLQSVSVLIQGTSYTMDQSAYLYGVHGGGVRGNASNHVYIYCVNGAATPIAMSGHGIEVSDCSAPVRFINATWNIPAAGGGFTFNRCETVQVDNNVTVNSDSTNGWSGIISFNSCNYVSWLAPVNISSSSTAGLGAAVVVNSTQNANWSANITKSGTKYGSTAVSVINNGYCNFGTCTINNFTTGINAGTNHYNAEIGAYVMANNLTLNTCTTGIVLGNGSNLRNYVVTFTSCTTNISHQCSIGANGYMGGQSVRGLFGYAGTQNDTYYLQVNSQIFATSATIATSDGRYKEEIVPITDGIDVLKKLRPVEFKWKNHDVHNFDTETKTVGFIAQEVQEALSDKPYLDSIVKSNEIVLESADIESVEIEPPTEAVFDEDGNLIERATLGVYEEVVTKPAVTEEFLGIAEGNMIAILTAALKEAVERIEVLEEKLNNI